MGYIFKKNAYELGQNAEDVALLFLTKQGYQFIAKRHKTFYGEIDLIMKNSEGEYIFIEVKARKTHKANTYAITSRQQKRILCAALMFMQSLSITGPMRFDAIWMCPERGHYKINHISNAWDGSLYEEA